MTIPNKVLIEITADKVTTKILDANNKSIGVLINKRDGPGTWSRKTKPFEKKYPDFMNEVDGFFGTDIASQLQEFAEGYHPDLENEI